jgi:hypothetical protein
MKQVNLKSEELISLNEDLHSEFRIQQLESRLETDPLLFADFFISESFADDICYSDLNICPTVQNICTGERLVPSV